MNKVNPYRIDIESTEDAIDEVLNKFNADDNGNREEEDENEIVENEHLDDPEEEDDDDRDASIRNGSGCDHFDKKSKMFKDRTRGGYNHSSNRLLTLLAR